MNLNAARLSRCTLSGGLAEINPEEVRYLLQFLQFAFIFFGIFNVGSALLETFREKNQRTSLLGVSCQKVVTNEPSYVIGVLSTR